MAPESACDVRENSDESLGDVPSDIGGAAGGVGPQGPELLTLVFEASPGAPLQALDEVDAAAEPSRTPESGGPPGGNRDSAKVGLVGLHPAQVVIHSYTVFEHCPHEHQMRCHAWGVAPPLANI